MDGYDIRKLCHDVLHVWKLRNYSCLSYQIDYQVRKEHEQSFANFLQGSFNQLARFVSKTNRDIVRTSYVNNVDIDR